MQVYTYTTCIYIHIYIHVTLTLQFDWWSMTAYVFIQSGQTPLYMASLNGHLPVVQLLLRRRANVSLCKKVCISFHILIQNRCIILAYNVLYL